MWNINESLPTRKSRKDQKETGDASPRVLPTSPNPSHRKTPQLGDA